MKRASTDVGAMAAKNLMDDKSRLERKVKEMAIEMASLSQNAADSEGRASHYQDKIRNVEQELARVQMYASELERQLHGGGGTAPSGRKALPATPNGMRA